MTDEVKDSLSESVLTEQESLFKDHQSIVCVDRLFQMFYTLFY